MFGHAEEISTPVQRGLNVVFNYTKQFNFAKVKPDLLEWFESGCLSFRVYAAQEETDDTALARSSRRLSLNDTRVSLMRERTSTSVVHQVVEESTTVGPMPTATSVLASVNSAADTAGAVAAAIASAMAAREAEDSARVNELQSRIEALQSQLDEARQRTPPAVATAAIVQELAPASERLKERVTELEHELSQAETKLNAREKRLHATLDQWFNKPPAEQSFEGLHQAISLIVNAPDRFRRATLAESSHRRSLKLVPATAQTGLGSEPPSAPPPSTTPSTKQTLAPAAEPARPASTPASTATAPVAAGRAASARRPPANATTSKACVVM
jgi:hypothetical protein